VLCAQEVEDLYNCTTSLLVAPIIVRSGSGCFTVLTFMQSVLKRRSNSPLGGCRQGKGFLVFRGRDLIRVRKTGGNRSGSTGSRWNRSGPVHEPVRFPPKNRAYKFAIPVNRPVFADSRKPLPGGFVNPGFDSLSWLVIWSIWCKHNRRVHDRAVLMLVTLAHLIVVEARRWVSAGFRGIALLLGSVT
jgi:hypothetical protein